MTSTLFLTVFIAYLLLMLWVGWYASRKQRNVGGFLLGGRKVPFFLTLGTTVATLVGTGSSMGAVGFGYENGWGGALYGIGGAVGLILCAHWFARTRRYQFVTMSEELSFYVGANRQVKGIVGVLILLASIGWLGAHILGGATYLSWVTGMDIQLAKLLIAAGFTLYIIVGGYTAVVWTDSLQAIVLFSGFILLVFLAVSKAGGFGEVIAAQPAENISFVAIEKLGWLPALSLAAVICIGVLATPSYRQRIYSASSVSTAKKSFITAGILYLLFSFIPAIVGMSAFALNPELDNRNFAFPFLTQSALPAIIGLTVLIAGLSATMSSASSDAIAAVASLLRDMTNLLSGNSDKGHQLLGYSRVALLIVVSVALLLSLLSNDIIGYITKMISTIMSGLFVCGVLGAFWQRFNWQGAIASLLSASATSFVILSQEQWLNLWGNPIIPAVIISFITGIVVSLCTPANTVSADESLEILTKERNAIDAQ